MSNPQDSVLNETFEKYVRVKTRQLVEDDLSAESWAKDPARRNLRLGITDKVAQDLSEAGEKEGIDPQKIIALGDVAADFAREHAKGHARLEKFSVGKGGGMSR